ncbi:MAG: hypothetical protein RIB57_11175 [Pelagibacterium sp.]|jgi:cytochrome c|uniref:c-type cytochrome n=1 Tax=Pelagibacterium sp. TaxID=1967288 RepID=UPI0032EFBF92
MNSFELNKIFGAILGTLVFVMGVSFIADEIYAPIEGRGADYALPEPAAEGEGGGEEAPGVPSIAARMQTASAEEGASLITRCQSCHDYSPSNENRTGPGIYGVVGHPIAGHEGFAYSDALATLGANGEIWDYEHLDAFLESPRNYAPGTKMSFAGLSNPDDRANLIAFLRENSDDPFPLPEAPAEEEAAPAEGEGGDEAPVEDELTAALAAVTPEDGEALIVRCQACHDYSPANANRVGPGIHNVVGAEIARHEGYSYSDALASLGAEGETWTPENLSAFLENPGEFAQGTRMSFPGLANVEDRAAVIVFLNSISDNPIELTSGGAAAEDTPAEQPAVEEVQELNLEEAAEGDDPVVIDAEEPQTEDAAADEGQPAAQ